MTNNNIKPTLSKKNKCLVIAIITAIIAIILIIVGIIFSIIYAPKNLITAREFEELAKENKLKTENLEIKDEHGNTNKDIKKAIKAKSKKNWEIEYYVVKNEKIAKKIFKDTKKIYESYKNQLCEKKDKSIENYNVYTLKTQTTYMHICRVENTLIIIYADDDDEKQIEKFVRKLGYH